MAEFVEISRIVVIADTILSQSLPEEFMKMGARGYNCIPCSGKGRHNTVEDPQTGRTLVRIEILATDAVAKQIMEYVHSKQFRPYPLFAFMDTAMVDARDKLT